jgi:dolichol-phosphate mannosyltransferase
VPCYNEEAVLHELHRRLLSACEAVVGDDVEFILVDDGSTDQTRSYIARLVDADPRFVGLFLSRNHGHQLALSAGLAAARGERVLVIDADLQDPPELLGAMMRRMDEGYDVVYGRRLRRRGETRFKLATAAAFYRLLKRLVEVEVPLDAGDFRLMSRRALDVLLQMPEQHRFIRGMVSWIGFAQSGLDYDRDERFAGETKYPLRKMLRFAMDAVTGFSTLPLRIAAWLGLMGVLLGLPIVVYVLASLLAGESVQGWASLMLLVLIMGSLQLLVLGVLGEYVGRMYMQSKGRPLFIIDEVRRSGGRQSEAARARSRRLNEVLATHPRPTLSAAAVR